MKGVPNLFSGEISDGKTVGVCDWGGNGGVVVAEGEEGEREEEGTSIQIHPQPVIRGQLRRTREVR